MMDAGTPIDRALESKHLYIVHLAGRLEAMELRRAPLNPIAYRVYAKRLRKATAGYPESKLVTNLSGSFPAVMEALSNRFFETHGLLPGADASSVAQAADQLFRRLARPAA